MQIAYCIAWKCTMSRVNEFRDKSKIKTLMREWRQTRILVENIVHYTISMYEIQSDIQIHTHIYIHTQQYSWQMLVDRSTFSMLKLSACKRSPFRFLPLRHCLKSNFNMRSTWVNVHTFNKTQQKICGRKISPSKRE